jgi:hypothetical protein
MKIAIPKELRGNSYDRVLDLHLNDFDVDTLLPALFFRVMSEGQERSKFSNNPTLIHQFVAKLASHPDVAGFASESELRALDRLVRTTLVRIGRRGLRRNVEQIATFSGHTFLTFKAGIPDVTSLHRRVDWLIYSMMRDQIGSDRALRAFFTRIFGAGLTIHGGPTPTGTYDGVTDLDTLTRLSIAFLDGFAPTSVRPGTPRPGPKSYPALALAMARDLRTYLGAYHSRMPVEALTYRFKALVNFELFIYTTKAINAVVALVERSDSLPLAMQAELVPSLPEIYVDFTGFSVGTSRGMAASCVRRDMETLDRFLK